MNILLTTSLVGGIGASCVLSYACEDLRSLCRILQKIIIAHGYAICRVSNEANWPVATAAVVPRLRPSQRIHPHAVRGAAS